MSVTLLADADFVVRDAGAFLRRASVAVRDGVIAEVGDAAALARRHPDAAVVDCRGTIVLPGLVNAHSHLWNSVMRGLGKRLSVYDWLRRLTYPVTRTMTDADHYWAVLLGCLDALRNGTTAIVDMPTHYARFRADSSMRALHDAGIRGAVVRAASDRSSVDPGEARPPAEDLAAAEAFLDRWQGRGRVQAWLGPTGFHGASPDLMARMKRLADRRQARFHVHLGESRVGIEAARREGYAGEVAWADAVGLLDPRTSVAHGVWMGETEMQALARAGAWVVHNPTSNQVLASGVADLPRLRAAGVPLALGTDGPASNDTFDMFAEMKAAVLLQRVHTLDPLVLTAADAFAMATRGSAGALGLDRVGAVAPGFAADLAVVRAAGNPTLTPVYHPVESLVYQASGRDVVLTMVDGEVLYRDGAFPRLDAARVFREVDAIAARIAAAHPELVAAPAP